MHEICSESSRWPIDDDLSSKIECFERHHHPLLSKSCRLIGKSEQIRVNTQQHSIRYLSSNEKKYLFIDILFTLCIFSTVFNWILSLLLFMLVIGNQSDCIQCMFFSRKKKITFHITNIRSTCILFTKLMWDRMKKINIQFFCSQLIQFDCAHFSSNSIHLISTHDTLIQIQIKLYFFHDI